MGELTVHDWTCFIETGMNCPMQLGFETFFHCGFLMVIFSVTCNRPFSMTKIVHLSLPPPLLPLPNEIHLKIKLSTGESVSKVQSKICYLKVLRGMAKALMARQVPDLIFC